MSHSYSGYGQPPADTSLPFPKTQPLSSPFQMTYGQPPFVPQVPFPTQLQNYASLITYEAIDALQKDYTRSELRVFLYNQMAANNYQNQDFYSFVQRLGELVDLVMRSRPQGDIQRTIQECSALYAKYKSADNCSRYAGLLVGMPQNVVYQIQEERNKFLDMMSQLERQYNPQPQYGQPAPNRNYQQGNANMISPVSPVSTAGLYAQSAYDARPQNTLSPSGKEDRYARMAPEVVAAPVERNNYNFGAQTNNAFNVPQQASGHSAMPSGVEWRRSAKYPYAYAFNPNTSRSQFFQDESGNLQPIIIKKDADDMDRHTHLAVPTIAPSWATPIPLGPTTTRSGTEYVSAPTVADLVAVTEVPALVATLSHNESWAKGQAVIDRMAAAARAKRAHATFGALKVETITVTPEVKEVIEHIALDPSTTTTVKTLDTLKTLATANHDRLALKAFRHMNGRITKKINRFLKKELALTSGAIGSYVEDAFELPAYLKSKFGEAILKQYTDNHDRLVTDSLRYLHGQPKIDILSNHFDAIPQDASNKTELVAFFEFNHYMTVDLSSVELAFDLPTNKSSVGILENETPVLYYLAKTVWTNLDETPLDNCYIQTSDGVVLEITRGILNNEFYFVSMVA